MNTHDELKKIEGKMDSVKRIIQREIGNEQLV